MTYADSLVWFRRDLRAGDHAALYAALKQSRRVHCAFVFDREILDALASRTDRRVEFIWHSVHELSEALERAGGGLHVLHGFAREAIPALAARLGVEAEDGVFVANDLMAQGALHALRHHGRSVPDDVAVIGFDDSSAATACRPPLTTIRHPVEDMAAEMARLLLDHIDEPGRTPRSVIFEPALIVRASG